jgi:SET domain-containing protein
MTPPPRRRLSDSRLASVVRVGRSAIHGRGLFAARAIARGEYIGTFSGPAAKADGMHVLWVYLDGRAEPVGRVGRNILRFLNHAKDHNAEFDGFDLFALRAIDADEELTIDYGW